MAKTVKCDEYVSLNLTGSVPKKNTRLLLNQLVSMAPDADVIYADDESFLRPKWSPELFECFPHYVGQSIVIRKQLLADLDVGGNGWVALTEILSRDNLQISHVPFVVKTGSPATCFSAYSSCTSMPLLPDFSTQISSSIIIPTRDRHDLLRNCIDSILTKTDNSSFEIIVVDNGSRETATFEYFSHIQQDPAQRVRVVSADVPFNWSRLNNIGAGHATGEVLLFLNNDIEVIAPDWLTWLCGYAVRPEIGVAGGLLLYEDDTIQHAGIVAGLGGFCDHLYRGLSPEKVQGSFVPPHIVRNVSAVTGACMAVKKERFLEIGGFDEEFEICGSDVELCLRFLGKGFRNVYAPGARLYHLESQTRSGVVPISDDVRLAQMFARYLPEGDPYYNPGLTLRKMDGSKKTWVERLREYWREPKWKRLLRTAGG